MSFKLAQNERNPRQEKGEPHTSETTLEEADEDAESNGDWDASVPLVLDENDTPLPKYHPLVGPYDSD